MDYFLELYGALPRAGPGDNASTRRAFAAMEGLPAEPRVLDLGCGPGVQTVELLRLCRGTVVALDLLPSMVARVERAAAAAGVADRLEAVQGDMNDLSFAPESFDAVWSEGAIYNAGFRNGLAKVLPLVKPGGYVAVSDVVWLRPNPPRELADFWQEYPEIDTAGNKLAIIAALGYEPVESFVLPASSWTEPYYDPLADRLAEYEQKWKSIEEAESVLAEARREVDLFRRYSDWYSYAFFVMRRP